MIKSNPFSLVLSCGGLQYNGLVLCSGTVNVIINFDKYIDADQIDKVVDFLDYSCSLFDRPIIDWNKIINTLRLFKDQYSLIDDRTWLALHAWLPQHKKCGGTLSLCLNNELEFINSDERLIIPTKT